MFQPSNLLTSRAAVGSVLAARTSTSAVVLTSAIGTRSHDVSDEVIEGNWIVLWRGGCQKGTKSKINEEASEAKRCAKVVCAGECIMHNLNLAKEHISRERHQVKTS